MRALTLVATVLACGSPSAPPASPSSSDIVVTPVDAGASASSTASAAPPDASAPLDEATFARECAPMLDAIKSIAPAPDRSREAALKEAMQRLMEHPPEGMTRAKLQECAAQFTVFVRRYIEQSIDVEAKVALQQIGRSMVAAFERESLGAGAQVVTHKLCPAAKAIPETLEKLGRRYTSSTPEWMNDAGWSCLKFSLDQPQRFQYEVRVDAGASSFIAVARRRSETEEIEFQLGGAVNGDRLELWAQPRERRSPRKP